MNTLVLAPDMTPWDEMPVERAVCLILEGKAQSLHNHPTRLFRNPTGRVCVPAPLVIVIQAMVDFAEFVHAEAPLSNDGVHQRDRRTCQYCGRHEREFVRRGERAVTLQFGTESVTVMARKEFLTIDHVTPKSRGGPWAWTNLVSACNTCNNRKRNLRPAEARMFLRRKPKAPTQAELWLSKLSSDMLSLVEQVMPGRTTEVRAS